MSPSAGPTLSTLITIGLALLLVPVPTPQDPANPPVVVLLHGLGRTDGSMSRLAAALEDTGFEVHNLHYPSTTHGPDELVNILTEQVRNCCQDARSVHFVTHSLGGILLRSYLEKARPENLGRVVMLAPPNHGSEIVDAVGDHAAFAWTLGPTAPELGTDAASLPNQLPGADYELGIIAGTRRLNPAGILWINGPSDGTVSVESTKLEGMSDFLTVPASHTFIMRSPEVAEQVIHFLRFGSFSH